MSKVNLDECSATELLYTRSIVGLLIGSGGWETTRSRLTGVELCRPEHLLITTLVALSFAALISHGQDAMLLVEGLIHCLIAKSVINTEEAIDIVNTAAEVKEEIAASLGDSAATMQKSLALLEAISSSLRYDLPQAT